MQKPISVDRISYNLLDQVQTASLGHPENPKVILLCSADENDLNLVIENRKHCESAIKALTNAMNSIWPES